jgi:hypothetical protein
MPLGRKQLLLLVAGLAALLPHGRFMVPPEALPLQAERAAATFPHGSACADTISGKLFLLGHSLLPEIMPGAGQPEGQELRYRGRWGTTFPNPLVATMRVVRITQHLVG